mmetsp:Transcript_68736/g.179060  ORF Transcript_68736/g.179060 Transcript_68736/m.179060 type:complete len:213 (+) Transcript_68736:855-1493(+)
MVHSDGLLVGDDGPDLLHHRVVVHVVREDQRRRHYAPGAEVRAGLLEAQARVAGAARPLLATDLQHVGVRPAARPRQACPGPRHRRQQGADRAPVLGPGAPAGPEGVPGAPRGGGGGEAHEARVAVLDHHRPARFIEEARPEVQVLHRAAPVHLQGVELEGHQCLHVPLVHGRGRLLSLRAYAIVCIPACRQPKTMRSVDHPAHGRKLVQVH